MQKSHVEFKDEIIFRKKNRHGSKRFFSSMYHQSSETFTSTRSTHSTMTSLWMTRHWNAASFRSIPFFKEYTLPASASHSHAKGLFRRNGRALDPSSLSNNPRLSIRAIFIAKLSPHLVAFFSCAS